MVVLVARGPLSPPVKYQSKTIASLRWHGVNRTLYLRSQTCKGATIHAPAPSQFIALTSLKATPNLVICRLGGLRRRTDGGLKYIVLDPRRSDQIWKSHHTPIGLDILYISES